MLRIAVKLRLHCHSEILVRLQKANNISKRILFDSFGDSGEK